MNHKNGLAYVAFPSLMNTQESVKLSFAETIFLVAGLKFKFMVVWVGIGLA